MADIWAVYLSGKLEADVLAGAVYFADTETEANELAAFYDNAFGQVNAYDSYQITDTDLTGGGTLTAVPGYPSWQYRNTGNDAIDQYRIEIIDAMHDDSSGLDSSDEESSFGFNIAGPGGTI